jgi:Peroxiredoxin
LLTTTLPVAAGDPAPDFVLPDSDGRTVRLRDLRGSAVILAFDGGAWDPSRADELAHFNALAARIPGANAELLGITRDGIWTELALADDAMRVPILADLDSQGSVAERFGVVGRAVMVLDEWGTVRWRYDGPAPRADDLLEALAALAPAPSDPASPRRLREPNEGDTRGGEPVAFGISARLDRREFIAATLAAAIAMAILPAAARAESAGKALTDSSPSIGATAPVTLTVNGRAITLNIEPRVTLLDALRE